ncbi:hypothetical protein AMS68_008026 [Peltaster fructicola]|uniref:Spindle pole body component n=1 Tax=Peltaster fructicola TaxID=286661 RepID=A0A6H0Y6Q9_9PEZI|nr:hypothetical protein AMS68_008026 [Peltaster fructicola]
MAHAARSLELVQGLVASITGRRDVSTLQCNQVIKSLREHNFARTNQFAVQSKLNGLIEKFSVLNRDDLAEALQSRLTRELDSEDKFLPDKLALLLELSDLPYRKVDIGVLEGLTRQEHTPVEELTWAEIIRDDPLDDDIWDVIERGYHSSGDEGASVTADPDSDETPDTTQSSFDIDISAIARAQLIQADDSLLAPAPSSDTLTEYKLVRETLFMLRGLPSDMFTVNRKVKATYISTNAALSLTTQSTMQSLVQRIAHIGSALNFLRFWSTWKQVEPHVRTCQAIVHKLLRRINNDFSTFEFSLIRGTDGVVISMMQLCAFAERQARVFLLLALLVRDAACRSEKPSVAILDKLHDAACTAHLTSDHEALEVFLELLVVSLRTFLRPFSKWCLTGQIDDCESNALIIDNNKDCPLYDVWQGRYSMRSTDGTERTIPAFLEGFADGIFVLGKSKMISNLLTSKQETYSTMKQPDDGQFVNLQHVKDSWIPFAQQFQNGLDNWLATLRRSDDDSLAELLIKDHKLLEHFEAIHRMFLHKDGAAFSCFGESMYQILLSRKRAAQLDDFMLTELARELFSSIDDISTEDISVLVARLDDSDRRIIRLLGTIDLQYKTPWYVANIMQQRHPVVERQIFTLLLQLDIGKRLLVNGLPRRRKCSLGRLSKAQLQLNYLQQCLICFIDTVTMTITTASERLNLALRKELSTVTSLNDMIKAYETYADALSLVAMTQTRLEPVRNAMIDVLLLSEEIVAVKQSIQMSGLTRQTMQVIRAACAGYQEKLLLIITRLHLEASEESGEALEAYADALDACLLDERSRNRRQPALQPSLNSNF